MWLLFMAKASIDTGQQALTFILIFLLLLILSGFASLLQAVTTQLFNILDWAYLRLPARHYPIKHCKKKAPLQPQSIATLQIREQARAPPEWQANHHATFHTARSYLVPLGLIAFKVGCCIECTTHSIRHVFPRPVSLQQITYQAKRGLSKPLITMRFDTDSFLIGINTFASITMVTWPEHFDELILTKKDGMVKDIEGGLAIKGKGTFKFNI
jgi:hypothetical protein